MSVWLVVVRRASELCFCYVLELGLLHVGAAAAAVAGLGARKRLVGWLAGWMDHDLMKGGGGGDAGTSLFAFSLRDPRGSCTIYCPASSWWSLGRERLGITMTRWRKRTTARGGKCLAVAGRKPLTRSLHSIA